MYNYFNTITRCLSHSLSFPNKNSIISVNSQVNLLKMVLLSLKIGKLVNKHPVC